MRIAESVADTSSELHFSIIPLDFHFSAKIGIIGKHRIIEGLGEK